MYISHEIISQACFGLSHLYQQGLILPFPYIIKNTVSSLNFCQMDGREIITLSLFVFPWLLIEHLSKCLLSFICHCLWTAYLYHFPIFSLGLSFFLTDLKEFFDEWPHYTFFCLLALSLSLLFVFLHWYDIFCYADAFNSHVWMGSFSAWWLWGFCLTLEGTLPIIRLYKYYSIFFSNVLKL